ncbi:unnamed protein product [Prunus armeniaca]
MARNRLPFHRPNQMKCDSDIKERNGNLQEVRVYIFLDCLDDRLDKALIDAYAFVQWEDLRQAIVMDTQASIAAGWRPRELTG